MPSRQDEGLTLVEKRVKLNYSPDQPLTVRVPDSYSTNDIKSYLDKRGVHPGYTPLPPHKDTRKDAPDEPWTLSSKVWDIIDTVDIPRAGTLSYIHALAKTKDPAFALKMAKRGFEEGEHPVVGDWIADILDNYKDGTIDKDTAKLLTEEVANNPPTDTNIEPWLYATVATFGGILGDVAVDPVSFVNPAASLTKQMLLKTPVRKVVETIGPKAREAVEAFRQNEYVKEVRKLYSTDPLTKPGGIIELQDVKRRLKDVTIMARENAVKHNSEIKKTIKQVARDTGIPEKDVQRFTFEMAERKDMDDIMDRATSFSDLEISTLITDHRLRNTALALQKKNLDQLNSEMEMGMRISALGTYDKKQLDDFEAAVSTAISRGDVFVVSPLTKKKTGITKARGQLEQMKRDYGDTELMQYINHAATPDFLDFIKKEGKRTKRPHPGKAFELNDYNPSSLHRKWKGMTVDEINTKARLGELPGYEGKRFDFDVFSNDPAYAQAIRDMRHAKVMAVGNIIGELKQKFGATGIRNLDEWKLANPGHDDWVIPTNPLMKNTAVPSEVAGMMDKYYDIFMNPKEQSKFLQGYDSMTRWWKAWTLSPFPSYHARNAAGNAFNNWVVGVSPTSYGDVIKMHRAIDDTASGITTKNGEFISWKDVKKDIDENQMGIRSRGLMAVDLEVALEAELGGAKWATLSADNKGLLMARKGGEKMEDYFRIANYIDGLKKGLSPAEAGHRVRQTLFDYSDITEFEQNVAKRLIPFYTWSRKNIPFQIENMVKHPGKYKAVDSMRREIEARQPEMETEERWLSQMFLENYPTRIGFDKQGNPKYFLLGTWLPAGDVIRFATAPQELIKDGLHPLIKTGYETFIAGEDGKYQNLFSGKVLAKEVMGETKEIYDDFLGTNMPRRLSNVLTNIRALSEMDRLYYGFNPDKRTPSIYPDLVEPRTGTEAMIGFLTGLRSMNANLGFQKQQYAKRLTQAEFELTGFLYTQLGAGVAPEKRKELITKTAQEFGVKFQDLSKRLRGIAEGD